MVLYKKLFVIDIVKITSAMSHDRKYRIFYVFFYEFFNLIQSHNIFNSIQFT